MSGLTLIILTADSLRFHGAITMAAAHAATGGKTRIHCHAPALPLLIPPHAAPTDAIHRKNGVPTLAQIIEDALSLGVSFTYCQTGLPLNGLVASQLMADCEASGPIALFGDLDDDRLIMI